MIHYRLTRRHRMRLTASTRANREQGYDATGEQRVTGVSMVTATPGLEFPPRAYRGLFSPMPGCRRAGAADGERNRHALRRLDRSCPPAAARCAGATIERSWLSSGQRWEW